MRNEGIVKFLFFCGLGLVAAVVLNIFLLSKVRLQFAPGHIGASVFNISAQIHEWSGYLERWKNLSLENEAFRASADKYIAAEAKIQYLETENETLRKSIGLSSRLNRKFIPAGIYQISLTPDGYHALINRGEQAGLSVGQAVISEEGLLVGKVTAVFSSSSRVMLVSDPGFSATVKVLNGQARGILRGALSEGLALDLITQSDEIKEEDVLVTTGDDLIPPGLVAGIVRNVENNDTQLFKKVRVNPAIDPSQAVGAVLVVRQ